jgi:hypothetical protein
MDLFKFVPGTGGPTVLVEGQAINGFTSVMWTERYKEPGEFEIQSALSVGLRDFLPLGTLISHADTLEVMIVENHEINETRDEDPTLTITGRTFDSILEQRIVGMNIARASTTHLLTDYTLPAAHTWEHANDLINQHIWGSTTPPLVAGDKLPNVVAQVDISGVSGPVTARTFDRGTVLERVHELLDVDEIGIKTARRNEFGVDGSPLTTTIYLYTGVDRSHLVHFSWQSGDLDSADYLFTNKDMKNSALVVSRYLTWVVDMGPVEYDRRMMIVDASDLDDNLDTVPTGTALADIINKMGVRGQEVLKAQKQITITRADISSTTQYEYRKDFNVGDLVSVDGNFGQIAKMRVVEFVEIQDENGESGHPTLALPGE